MARSLSAEERHHVDVHVGKQLALARHAQGYTQTEVARMLGLTFQQIQKYEKGTNRMSASVLWTLSEKMNVSVGYFFEGLEGKTGEAAEHIFSTLGRHGMQMAEAYASMPKRNQMLLLELAKEFAGKPETAPA